MTIEANWQFLVEAQKQCPTCSGAGTYGPVATPDENCNGTGLVPVLPGLRKECSCFLPPERIQGCTTCFGTSWVAKPPDMPLLQSEMRKAGFRPRIGASTNPITKNQGTLDSFWFVWGIEQHETFGTTRDILIEGGDDFAACVRAARLAVEAKYPQKEKA